MSMDAATTMVAIVVLLFMSAFFSGSETALTAVSRARMLRLAQDGDRRAQMVDRLADNKERLLGTILFGNNAVNIFATALATSLFTELLGGYAVAAASVAMTVLVLIFAEVLPKTFAITNSERSALAVAPLIRWLVPLFSPITSAIQGIVEGTLRLFGVAITDMSDILTAQDELRGTIDLHTREGSMIKPDKDMLGGILDLDNITVEQVMVHRRTMEMIDIDQPREDIVKQVMDSPYTRLPLWRDDTDNIVGILHAKDVLRGERKSAAGEQPDTIEEMAKEPWFVPETTTLREQLNAFRDRRAHFALVVDEYGALMGLVTLEDILEEIVGDISDEHDIDQLGIRPQSDGRIVVGGDVPIRDLNREMDWNLDETNATTLAGYVIAEAQIIPDPGQMFLFHGYKFEIMQKERNQITLIRVTPPDEDDESLDA